MQMFSSAGSTSVNNNKPVRWWPLLVIIFLTIIVCLYYWFYHEANHQYRYLNVIKTVLISHFLVLIWALLLSRFGKRLRIYILAVYLALVAVLCGSLRIKGVTGDVLPILEWRWKKRMVEAPQIAVNISTNMPAALNITDPDRYTNHFDQFLGPNRNAKISGIQLETNWHKYPPTVLWKKPVGTAWSGFAISGHSAITMEQHGEEEYVVCYQLDTGNVLWKHSDRTRYATTIAGEGPRTTPSITKNRVVTLGATGFLNCLDLTTGKKLWGKNIAEDNQAVMPMWGFSGSPLIFRDRVIISAGGTNDSSLVAYNIGNGDKIWAAGTNQTSYSSPCLFTLHDMEQILIFNTHYLVSHEAQTGKVLWQYPWPPDKPHIAVPVYVPENQIIISSGYGLGAAMLKIEKNTNQFTVNRIWKSTRLKAKFNNFIQKDNHIYGLDDGIFTCLDSRTGETRWKSGRYGHGQMLLVDRWLLVTAETGDLILMEPIPEEHREVFRLPVLSQKTWNPPAMAGDFFLMRNDQEIVCLKLPIKQPSN